MKVFAYNNYERGLIMEKKSTKRIPQLEGMRFIMCCIIVLSHFEFLGNLNVVGGGYTRYFHNAVMAVDYFFMLSGFGMCLSSRRPEKSLRSKLEFATNKIKKIYPAYIISLIIMIPYTFFDIRQHGCSIINSGMKSLFLFGVDLSLLQSIAGMTFFSHSLNGVCWFLSCIFICYFIMSLILKKIDTIKNKRRVVMYLFGSIIMIELLSFVFSIIENANLIGEGVNDLWYGHPIIRCWYLFIGALLGLLYNNTNIKFKSSVEIGTIGIMFFYFLSRNSILEIVNQNFLRLFDVILCAWLLFCFSKGEGIISQKLSTDKMIWLGHISMYLYLFHYPVRLIVDKIFVKINVINVWGEFSLIIEVILIIILAISCVYMYIKISNLKQYFVKREL